MAAEFARAIELETDVGLPISMAADGLTVESAAAYVEASLAARSSGDPGHAGDAVLVPFRRRSAETPTGAIDPGAPSPTHAPRSSSSPPETAISLRFRRS